MRVNYDIDRDVFASISQLTVGEFKNLLLRSSAGRDRPAGPRADRASWPPPWPRFATCTSWCCSPRRCRAPAAPAPRWARPARWPRACSPTIRPTTCAASRLLVYWGLSLGSGDALIGINPAVDTVENVDVAVAAPRQVAAGHRRADANLRARPHQDATGLPGARSAGRDPVSKPGRHRGHADRRVRRHGRAAR